MKIALLGVGLMGQPMARRLIEAKHQLYLWNRTQSKLAPFEQEATLTSSPIEAISQADVIITMLENGPVIDALLFESGDFKSAQQGALWIDMSSITPELAKKHAKLLNAQDITYIDAPVSGGTVGAEQGTLSIMAGGSEEGFARALPILSIFGDANRIGPTGCGQLAKLANQAIVGITIGAVSEALLLAREGGADLEAVKKSLMGGFASSRILELHGQRMIEGNFEPGARARVQLKDLRMILDQARVEGLSLPLAQRTYESYQSLVSRGLENVDHSGLFLELEALNQVSNQPVNGAEK
ncbi:MAG: NAD(P)-dependent oxidoreductase [Oleiphilaceae bacterium]|nr:NAD(P)-dependent oxidoreductase [Oleiphilaceae bacterium]